MSRYCGKNDSAPILSAANHWKDEAFLADGSVFDSRALWTVEGLEALETHFVRNLDEGGGTFIAKLEGQLKTTPPFVKQLAAEMLWLMFLCVALLSEGWVRRCRVREG